MHKQFSLAVVAALAFAGTASAQALKTDDDKALYSLGYSIGSDFAPTAQEIEIIKKGMSDGSKGAKAAVDTKQFGPKLRDVAQARAKQKAEKNKKGEQAHLEKAAKQKGAVKEKSGLVFIPVTEGKGASPKATDTVKVHYRGTLTTGEEFDSSYKRNEPAEFPLNGVIPCWTEGLQKMKVGGKAKLVCPSDIAYGDMGRPGIPPGATLNFDVELLEVKSK